MMISQKNDYVIKTFQYVSDHVYTPEFRVLARISKMPVQIAILRFLPIPIKLLIYFKSLYQLHLIAYCVKKGILHFSHVLEDGLLGKYLVVTLHMSKLKILHRKFCLSKKKVFRKLSVQKTGGSGPGKVPASPDANK